MKRRTSDRRREHATIALLIFVYWLGFQTIYFAHATAMSAGLGSLPRFLSALSAYILQPVELLIVGCGAALCYVIYAGLRLLRFLPFPLQLLLSVVAATAGAFIFAFTVQLILVLFMGEKVISGVGYLPLAGLTSRAVVAETTRWFAPFASWAAISLALIYSIGMREREMRLADLQIHAQQAQMRALRYQVNPHFLYNTLNSISALILDGKNDLAEAMVLRLSAFFRSSLASDPTHDVLLMDEIMLQKLYLDIEQVRFSDQLHVTIDMPDALHRALVPSLILQPIIENAVKYGVGDAGQVTHVAISADAVDNRLVLEVCDNGCGASMHNVGTGVGLANVRRRLETQFGAQARFEAGRRSDGGFRVRLEMPLRLAN